VTVNKRVLNVAHQHATLIMAQADGWSPHRILGQRLGHQFVEEIVTLCVRAARADVENDLPFGRRTAHMFMAIARDERLSNGNLCSHLPPHWVTLYKITRLGDETLERLIDGGTIRPDTGAPMVARARVSSSRRAQ
jgi:hypothetical protein